MTPYLNVASCDSLQIESSIRQQQIIEEPSDEWDFGDDSKLHIKNFIDARKQCETIVQSDRSNEMLHDSSQMNLNPTALKRPWVEPPPNREQEQTLLKLARKDTSNCCLSERMRNSFCGNHSQNLMDHEREQDLYCGEYQRKSESCFQGVEERESFLSDSQLKNKATPETPKNYSKSQFLSSMDDGKFDKRNAFQVDGKMSFCCTGSFYFCVKMIRHFLGVTRGPSQTNELQNLQAMILL